LGRAVGNAVEIIECIDVLRGRGPADLVELTTTIATRMLLMSGLYDDATAEPAVRGAIASGTALEKLRAIITRQGGAPAVVDDYQRLPGASHRGTVTAPRSGFITRIGAEAVGRAAVVLGAGRERAGDRIDHGAGVLVDAHVGDAVAEGQPVLTLLSNNARAIADARAVAAQAVRIGDAAPPPRSLVIDICTSN
jgi:thymidine phosphorylase